MAYKIIYQPEVLEKIEDIHDYIANVLVSPVTAKKRVKQIFDEIQIIKVNPIAFPSVDEKIGRKIDKRYKTYFSVIVSGKYLVFFFVADDVVYISHLLPTETDYMSLFR